MLAEVLSETNCVLFVLLKTYNWKGHPEMLLSLFIKAAIFYNLADEMMTLGIKIH